MLIVGEDFVRHTDGTGAVVSRDAVFEDDIVFVHFVYLHWIYLGAIVTAVPLLDKPLSLG